MNRENKCVQKNFRITAGQQQHIKKNCQLLGIHESEFMRRLIDADRGRPVVRETQEAYQHWKELQYEMNRIGTNINQIAKNVNSHYYTDYEKKKLFAMMAKLTELLSEL